MEYDKSIKFELRLIYVIITGSSLCNILPNIKSNGCAREFLSTSVFIRMCVYIPCAYD